MARVEPQRPKKIITRSFTVTCVVGLHSVSGSRSLQKPV